MWRCASMGDYDNLARALAGDVDVDAPEPSPERRTALHLAAAGGHARCVTALLAAGASPLCRTRHGTAPQHLAAEGGHAEALHILLRHGADANADSMPTCQWTPLFYAAAHGHLDAVRVLLDHGARYFATARSSVVSVSLPIYLNACRSLSLSLSFIQSPTN